MLLACGIHRADITVRNQRFPQEKEGALIAPIRPQSNSEVSEQLNQLHIKNGVGIVKLNLFNQNLDIRAETP